MNAKMKSVSCIDRAFKMRFGMKLCLVATAGLLATTAFVYSVISERLGNTYAEAIYTIYSMKIKIFPLIFASFYTAGILAFAAAAIAVISVLFSHKIAGPVYRIEKSLEAIEDGDLTVVMKLRAGDQLTPAADEVNGMARALNHRVRSMNDALEEIKSAEERLSGLLDEKAPAAGVVREAAESLRNGIEGLKKAAAGVNSKEH